MPLDDKDIATISQLINESLARALKNKAAVGSERAGSVEEPSESTSSGRKVLDPVVGVAKLLGDTTPVAHYFVPEYPSNPVPRPVGASAAADYFAMGNNPNFREMVRAGLPKPVLFEAEVLGPAVSYLFDVNEYLLAVAETHGLPDIMDPVVNSLDALKRLLDGRWSYLTMWGLHPKDVHFRQALERDLKGDRNKGVVIPSEQVAATAKKIEENRMVFAVKKAAQLSPVWGDDTAPHKKTTEKGTENKGKSALTVKNPAGAP